MGNERFNWFVRNNNINVLCRVNGQKHILKIPVEELLTDEGFISSLKSFSGICSVKKESVKAEKKVAKKYKWNRTPQSGATCGYDHSSDKFIIEQKSGKKQITLKKEMIDKLNKVGGVKDPVFILDFDGEHWFLIPDYLFERLENG